MHRSLFLGFFVSEGREGKVRLFLVNRTVNLQRNVNTNASAKVCGKV